MQVGLIKIDGRPVGVINFTVGRPEPIVPYVGMDGVGNPGAEAPIGGGEPSERGGRRERGDHSHGYHTPHSRSGTAPHDPGRSTAGPVSVGKGDDPRGLESHIRSSAAKHGVDPDTAMAVAKSEGLRDFSGDKGTSFGAFQLHKNGGLGDEFQKETGLDPSDPANERATIDWAMKNAKRTGWGPYHGAKRVGVGRWDGIGGQSKAAPGPAADAPKSLKGDDVSGFIMHHTGGRGTPEGVQNTLRQRGLGVQYIMDREGNIIQSGERGASHMMTGWGKGAGLSNRNTVGMEVIAKDNSDVTPAQVSAAKTFISKNYPNTPVFGHGEVNPGHKEVDEGMAIVNAIRSERSSAAKKPVFNPGIDAL